MYFIVFLHNKILTSPLGIVADEAEAEVHFHTTYSHNMMASSSSSFEDSMRPTQDPLDFSAYMDQVSCRQRNSHLFLMSKFVLQAPLTVQSNSPLEMIHQFFVKLGARYVVVTDTEGLCKYPPFAQLFMS